MTLTGDPHTDLAPSPWLQQSIAESRNLFVAAMKDLRPRLHRFCTRMCGSPLDGEDIVQETLAEAFYGFAALKDPGRLESWVFRIAYHKSIDFIRREHRRQDEVAFDEQHDPPDDSAEDELADAPIDEALVTLVGQLPPKERACVLLKDVLDHPLSEIADIADSTLGGVKAALHRARTKLRQVTAVPVVRELNVDQRRLFEAYADCFNRRDWDALRHLVSADARLEIVGAAEGRMSGLGSTYSGNYTTLPWAWRLAPALINGTPAIVHWRQFDSEWRPHAAICLSWRNGRVVGIRDYIHVDYLLQDASVEPLG